MKTQAHPTGLNRQLTPIQLASDRLAGFPVYTQ
jgi:hypothetical protein